ncbi:hypothetical protein ACFVYE_44050 [Streptomyces sp. NPDC058239]|uniref:hypothetical protein n=1 Tax=Streptomyces sp. NPDC058239 TaxID=3346395 RepID=UPI0036EB0F4A
MTDTQPPHRTETVIDSYGTGHVHTRILLRPDGRYDWVRTPGAARTQPFGVPSTTLVETLAATTADRPDTALCVVPRTHGGALRYATSGHRSIAWTLLREGPAAHATVRNLLRAQGAALSRMHAAPVPAGLPTLVPSPLRRLLAWLEGTVDGPADRLHTLVRRVIGPARWHRLRSWADRLTEASPGVPLHGGPSLGLLVPAPHHDSVALLTGEDAGLGPWQWDAGWVLGELAEFRDVSGRSHPTGDGSVWDGLETAFLDGLQRAPDETTRGTAVLRRALHLHDYCAFVRWNEQEVRACIADLIRLIDSRQRQETTPR